ncbi:MAG: hypothetical protein WCT07_03410 [Candidatus Paceibacterota bacterium]|jgi:hypothetical protein
MNELDYAEISFFKHVVGDVRLLMDLYYDYFMKELSSDKSSKVPLKYTLVRAAELSFFGTHDLKAVTGYCSFCIFNGKNLKVRSHSHQWLLWRDKYIIDVVPLDGMFGVSVPQAVFPKDNYKRFSALPGLYPKNCSAELKKKLDADVENLSQIFDELFQKVPT